MIGVVKIAVANFIGQNLVNRVFDQPQLYSSTESLGAIYGYALQIYLNFSGYIDIALASALLLGFRLPVNFNSPYRAEEHAGLLAALAHHAFEVAEGLRLLFAARLAQKNFNLYWKAVVTMLIGGIWHGAGWTFLIWGALHGLGVAVNRWWDQRRRKLKRKPRQDWWIKACASSPPSTSSAWRGFSSVPRVSVKRGKCWRVWAR